MVIQRLVSLAKARLARWLQSPAPADRWAGYGQPAVLKRWTPVRNPRKQCSTKVQQPGWSASDPGRPLP